MSQDSWSRANAASIDAIPEDYLPEGPERAAYRQRAEAGDDIYAYPSPSRHVWNVWADGERIAFEPPD